jgi:hypothetical protein
MVELDERPEDADWCARARVVGIPPSSFGPTPAVRSSLPSAAVGTIESGRRHLEALRVARKRQLVARALRPINRRRTRPSQSPGFPHPLESLVSLWRSRAFASSEQLAARLPEGVVEVLGIELPYPPDWSGTGLSRLRRFHLHYGEEILGSARLGGPWLDAARAGIASWIDQNRPGAGDGWHPYALSSRVGNWLAAFSIEPSLATPAATTSAWHQLTFLARNIENDILGNHLIRNARALVLGGVAFDDASLVDKGVALLERELTEQILPDGGHYERSPVYHAIVLRDLLEIRGATELERLDAPLRKMAAFAAVLRRPDGNPALFNDGGIDLSPDLSEFLPASEPGLSLFPETGYLVARRSTPQLWLAVDCGAAAPAYLPPHAHADALSFQLWVDGRPVVVDPGTVTYEPGPERDWFRGTRAHPTVSIDGKDQFELWGAFRAHGIPDVTILDVEGSELEGSITASVEAFRSVGGVSHRRRVSWSSDTMTVEDRLEGRGRRLVESALPLAPSVTVEQGSMLRVDGVAIEPIGLLRATVEERAMAERFYERVSAPAIVLRGEVDLPADLGWNLQFNSSHT